MTNSSTTIDRLTRAEEDLMQWYWDHGASTVSALIEKMPDPKPPHSTISSITRILENKGFLDHNTYGRTHEYFPTISKERYSKFSLKGLIADYFEGSANDLVSFLVNSNEMSIKDLEEIKSKLNALDTNKES